MDGASSSPLNYEGEALFLVQGTLSQVQHAHTVVNLLAKFEKHAQTKNLATGAAGAVGDMYGMLANSAMLALYDGEDMVNFAGLLDGQVVCGSFAKGDTFKDGDTLKIVASKRGDVLYAHAVMREDDKMLFMPLTVVCGVKAHFRHCMKVAWRFTVFAWIFTAITFFFLTKNDPFDLSKSKDLFFIFLLAIFPVLIMYPMEYWTYRSTRELGDYGSAIFKVFGFPRPDDLDLVPSMHYSFSPDQIGVNGAFNYEKALKSHASVVTHNRRTKNG
jgi:hypothetical protein